MTCVFLITIHNRSDKTEASHIVKNNNFDLLDDCPPKKKNLSGVLSQLII